MSEFMDEPTDKLVASFLHLEEMTKYILVLQTETDCLLLNSSHQTALATHSPVKEPVHGFQSNLQSVFMRKLAFSIKTLESKP
jgi:hypothetical protein